MSAYEWLYVTAFVVLIVIGYFVIKRSAKEMSSGRTGKAQETDEKNR